MKSFYLFLMLLCGACFFTSCHDDDDVNVSVQDVPSAVLKSFNQLYKGIDDVKWEKVDEYHVARFNGYSLSRVEPKYITSAWFAEDGTHLQADQDIAFEDMPLLVRNAFKEYQAQFYPDWKLDDCEVVVRYGMSLIYVIEIEKNDLERKISISVHGDILKDVLDDDDDVLPVFIPDEINAVLRILFPEDFESISLLELEIDDDEIELDILHGNRHKEITLDTQYHWIKTEYDVTIEEAMKMLSADVLQKLLALASQFHIDLYDPLIHQCIEIEITEHVTKGWFMELEIEIGDLEIEIKIDKDGNIELED